MAKDAKQFLIDTSPTKGVVVGGITRDATDEECIFDLIDNSIDAARNAIFSAIPEARRRELPDNYFGYKINLHLSGAGFTIEDNCGGISIEHLRKVALRFGERSEQAMGIGAFGIGLNRALLRLGGISSIVTETAEGDRAEVVIKKEEYLRNFKTWELPARRLAATGAEGTRIEIKDLPTLTASNFADDSWIKGLIYQIGRRYGRFIQKRLAIRVGSTVVPNEEIQIRDDGPYESQSKLYKTEQGVLIQIEYGQHELHRFPGERGHSEEQNRRLTGQYGWTILCNDRAIILSDRSVKTGWDVTKFHSEFYGFVGNVNFISPHPDKLPWTTTKTDIDLNNPAYQMALRDMRHFTEDWRSAADKRKKTRAKGERFRPLPPKKSKPEPEPPVPPKEKGKAPKEPPKQPPREDHNQYREVLPADLQETHCFDKHLALVHEAKRIDMVDNPYAGLALTRMLFETSTVKFCERHGKLDQLRQFAIDRRRKKGLDVSGDREKNAAASLEEMLLYFEEYPGIWGTGKQTYMRHSVKNMQTNLKLMNSALHHPLQPIQKTKAIQIRDEALPLLRHLIEK